ncbi:MAG: response regulator [Candidatus Methylomirabilales bacterium]
METVLVVDDEEPNRELLEAILEADGYRVLQAADGAEALARVAADRPDIVLLDLLMPGMSGLEVCERLKQDPERGDLPILVVTALGQISAKEAALTRGADDFVTKPIRAEEIRARVAAMLKVRHLRQDLDRSLAYLHELEVARRVQRRAILSQMLADRALPAVQPAGAARILLVDDEGLAREFYGDLLTEHGFEVHTATGGEAALELTSRQAFDVAILDIVMPGMSGLQLLEELRRRQPDLPAIMLTGHLSSQHALAALKLGAFDFIVKGLEHSLIVLAVHRAIRSRRERQERQAALDTLKRRVAELEAWGRERQRGAWRTGVTPQTPIAVLWIGDDPLLSTLCREVLEDRGYLVVTADGATGVEVARRERPDVILVAVMPATSGFEVCQSLRADPRLKNTPIIVLAALDDPGLSERAREAGATVLLRKPAQVDELVRAIEYVAHPQAGL